MRKKLISTVLILSLIISLSATAFAAAGGTGEALYENVTKLADGFYYTNTISMNGSSKRVESFTLETTPDGPVYPIVIAEDYLYSNMTIDEVIDWASQHGYNVHAAINADFFYGSMSLPIGGIIENGEYITAVNEENLLCFGSEGAFYSVKPVVKLELDNLGGGETTDPETGETHTNAGKHVSVENLNKLRTNTGGLFMYSSAYHEESTQTSRKGWAVRFKILEGELKIGTVLTLSVEQVIPECTDIEIGEGYLVLSAPLDNGYTEGVDRSFAPGDTVRLELTSTDERLKDALWACGCGDVLVENGKMTDPALWDEALNKRAHPRTAVGIKADGSVIACVIDGRSSSYSNGAMLEELAQDMIARGCVSLLNLDGGGSTVMALRIPGSDTCTIVNRPSDGKLRKSGSYILFVSDLVPDTIPDSLYLNENGAMVLTGASIPVSVSAVDNAIMPADYDGVVDYTSSLGIVEDGVYTAGDTPGRDLMALTGMNIFGEGSIIVTDKLDTLSVIDEATGKSPVLSELEPGYSCTLTAEGTYLGRDVAVDAAAVTWSVTEGLGEITHDGVLTLYGGPVREGELTAKAGGLTMTLPIGFKARFEDVPGHWAEEYINTLYDMGIVNGVSDGIFRPSGSMIRQDFVVMLWRSLGSPVIDGECLFNDVPEDSYYYDAVKWASTVGITNGVNDTSFGAKQPLTREQAFTMLYRLMSIMRFQLPVLDGTALEAFTDSDTISSYAREAAETLVLLGAVSGDGGTLMPRQPLNRAQMAKLLCLTLFNN